MYGENEGSAGVVCRGWSLKFRQRVVNFFEAPMEMAHSFFSEDITFLQYEGIAAEVKKYALLFCKVSGKVNMSRRKEIDIVAKFMCNVISYTLKRTVDITVVIPTPTIPQSLSRSTDAIPCVHTPKEKYPVLYLLHGMGNNHATWTGYTNVEMYAEERNIAVVNISGENKAYIRTEDDDFFKFISEELPDFVCGMFPKRAEKIKKFGCNIRKYVLY